MANLDNISRTISFLLRHKPESKGLVLDKNGYTDVNDLLKAVSIDKDTLDEIVRTDKKGRYSYDKSGTKIRANQGHSVKGVEIDFKHFTPVGKIYHGTADKYLESILKNGLCAQTRQYVHLSQDIDTATSVGMRHAKNKNNLVIFEIDTDAMIKDGFEFLISENNVVLTKTVPVKYLKRIV